jgi:hypothetical protein
MELPWWRTGGNYWSGEREQCGLKFGSRVLCIIPQICRNPWARRFSTQDWLAVPWRVLVRGWPSSPWNRNPKSPLNLGIQHN